MRSENKTCAIGGFLETREIERQLASVPPSICMAWQRALGLAGGSLVSKGERAENIALVINPMAHGTPVKFFTRPKWNQVFTSTGQFFTPTRPLAHRAHISSPSIFHTLILTQFSWTI